jgi:hypothetical protein
MTKSLCDFVFVTASVFAGMTNDFVVCFYWLDSGVRALQ